MPKPNYENMWQVTVKAFKAEDSNNTFVMTGVHRLTVTMEDLKFFPLGSATPMSFPITSLRCVRKAQRWQFALTEHSYGRRLSFKVSQMFAFNQLLFLLERNSDLNHGPAISLFLGQD